MRGSDDTPEQPRATFNDDGAILLDFLYPAGTLNFIRQYSGWGFDKPDRRRKSILGKFSHRLFTSSAQDGNAMEASEAAMLEDDKAKPQMLTYNQSLQDVLRVDETGDYEEAWFQFCNLRKSDQRLLEKPLLEYLEKSTRVVDAERVIDLFDRIPVQDRDLNAHKSAISSYIRLRNVFDALEVFVVARDRFSDCSSLLSLLVYMMDNSLWSLLINTYLDPLNLRSRDDDKHFFESFRRRPNIARKAIEITRYLRPATLKQKSLHVENKLGSVPSAILFAVKVARAGLYSVDCIPIVFKELFDFISNWDVENHPRLYNSTIRYLLHDVGLSSLARHIYRKGREEHSLKLEKPVLTSLLRHACDDLDVKTMYQIMEDYAVHYGVPPPNAYCMCMAALASMGEASTLHALFDQYSKTYLIDAAAQAREKTLPYALTSILQVHAKRGEITEVIRHFHEIWDKYGVQPNLVCYNILINAYWKVGDIDNAFSCFEEILKSDVLRPDSITFGTVMGICVAAGDLDRAIELYRLAGQSGIKKNTGLIDCLVVAHLQDFRIAEAEKICEEALTMDLEGSRTLMWNHLMMQYALHRDLANVNRLLQRMTDNKISHDGVTYAILMKTLCVAKVPDMAYRILTEAMPEAGIRVTDFHWSIIMAGYLFNNQSFRILTMGKNLRLSETRETVLTQKSEMEMDLRLPSVRKDYFLKEETTEEQAARAREMFKRILESLDPKDVVSMHGYTHGLPVDMAVQSILYSWMMSVIANTSGFSEVEQLYERYISLIPENKLPFIGVLSPLMTARIRQQDWKAVDQCWDLALQRAREQSKHIELSEAPKKLLSSAPHRKDGDLAVPVKQQLALSSVLSKYIGALSRQNRVQEATALIDSLCKEGFVLSNHNWNSYISFLARRHRYKLAFELTEKHLMDNWTGWERELIGIGKPGRHPLEMRVWRKNPRYAFVRYPTMLYLGRAYLELEEQAVGDVRHATLLRDLEYDCPRAMEAVKTMPRTGIALEEQILRGNGVGW